MKKKYLFAAALGAVAGVVGYKIGSTSSRSTGSRSTGYTGATGSTDSTEAPGYALRPGVPKEDPHTPLGCDMTFSVDQTYTVDPDRPVRVLITGAGSYIGESFREYVSTHYSDKIECSVLDMKRSDWREAEVWSEGFDTVFHVAGIAHADVSKPSREMIENYYRINTDLAIETASHAKECGVKQFIFMSSAIIYGDTSSTGGKIDRTTTPRPANFYGDSKWQADKGVRALASTGDGQFKVAVLRPPMIYGRDSKGNYPQLSKLAQKLPVFPEVKNTRSMLYIENLCEFLVQVMIGRHSGIFFPQNAEYSSTSDLVRRIAETHNHRIMVSRVFNPVVEIARLFPVKKIRGMAQKAFGDSWYEMSMSQYEDLDYQKISLEESIRRTESS